MKHEDIYHTCDRCGKRIKNNIEKAPYLNRYIKKNYEIETTKIDNMAYIDEIKELATRDEAESVKIYEMSIRILYRANCDRVDLCKDCRKAFERFMRNEI